MTAYDDYIEGVTWFSVEYSHLPDEEDPAEKFFATLKDARDFADEKAKTYRHVWVSEFGEYTLISGKHVQDWIYFWWTDHPDWGEHYGRGQGYASETPNRHREYEPLGPEPLRGIY